MKTIHRIINGDSRRMKLLDSGSVHLIITSPPYWQLKDYGNGQQIGYHDSYENYINNLNLVWKECFRVLYPGCRLCINIGDQFARSVYYGRYKVIPIRTEIIKFCEILGFDYMGAIIWQKVTTTNTTGGATIMGSFPYPRNGILKIDYEFILIFKKQGTSPKPTAEQKIASSMTTEEWNSYFSGHWNFPGVRQDGHIAMFPEELPSRLIRMFSFVNETILDPFLGSGTTTLSARNLNRNSVGYEINPDFVPRIKEKLNVNQLDMNGSQYIFLQQDPLSEQELSVTELPYCFKDPHRLDKKIDPKLLQFGSRIDRDNIPIHEYYIVKDIISPELLKLNNGLVVRLLGIIEKAEYRSQAINFLVEKLHGERIFLKFDTQKYDENNTMLGYIYLKNKTFINAHLIKSGFVGVERSIQYRYRNQFTKLEQTVSSVAS